MKKISVIIIAMVILVSCSSTKESQTTATLSKNEKKLLEQSKVKRAVESKRFIVKFDRLYFNSGGTAYLMPRANYIIIDGNKAIISTAYVGKQYDIRPIAGINMRGENTDYEVTNNIKKGAYEIKMKVKNSTNTFSVFLTIDKNGSCNASLTTLYIDFVRYTGNVIPIKENVEVPLQDYPVIG